MKVKVDISGRLPEGVTEPFIEQTINATYQEVGESAEVLVDLSIVDDQTMRALNFQHRGLDKTTDVLSFPYLNEGEDFAGLTGEVEQLLGEIVISAEQIARQAEQVEHSAKAEFALMLIHGTLHLLGYDHLTTEQEKEMFSLQEKILADLEIE